MEFTTGLWLWIGIAGMTAGSLPTGYRLVTTDEHRELNAVLFGVTGIAAVAYLLMALGYGTIAVGSQSVEIVRYVDWLLTTPLIVLYLGLLSRPGRRVLRRLVAVDVAVVLAGIAATAVAGLLQYVFFGLGTIAYLVLVQLLVQTLPERATFSTPREESSFTTLRNLTVIV